MSKFRNGQRDAASFERGRMRRPLPAIVDGEKGEFSWEASKTGGPMPAPSVIF